MSTLQDHYMEEIIEQALQRLVPTVILNNKATADDVRNRIRTYMRSHPEIFWFSHQYSYDETSGTLRFKYNFTKNKVEFFKKEIRNVITEDFQIEYVATLPEIDRLVYVYKWIANRTTYNGAFVIQSNHL